MARQHHCHIIAANRLARAGHFMIHLLDMHMQRIAHHFAEGERHHPESGHGQHATLKSIVGCVVKHIKRLPAVKLRYLRLTLGKRHGVVKRLYSINILRPYGMKFGIRMVSSKAVGMIALLGEFLPESVARA